MKRLLFYSTLLGWFLIGFGVGYWVIPLTLLFFFVYAKQRRLYV